MTIQNNRYQKYAQRFFLLEKRILASMHNSAAQKLSPLLCLAFLILIMPLTLNAQSSGVLFTGNNQIDFLATCDYGSDITDATVVIYRDGIQIIKSRAGTEPNHKEFFYRDTDVSKGNTYKYSRCCLYKTINGPSESCPPATYSATAGEVRGTLIQDLEITGGTLALHSNIYVKEGATLSISGATIENATNSLNLWIKPGYPSGTIRITDSSLTDVHIGFNSAGNNLLSGNVIISSDSPTRGNPDLKITEEAIVLLKGNTLVNLEIWIYDHSSAHIEQNSFQNSSLDIGNGRGLTTVQIYDNEFNSSEVRRIMSIYDSDATVQGNVFTKINGDKLFSVGLLIDTSMTALISNNLFSGFYTALDQLASNEVTISGNVFKDNSTGYYMRGMGIATVTDNTFFQNGRGIAISATSNSLSLTLNNNCIADNNQGLSFENNGDHTVIDAVSNWWGAISGPRIFSLNPDGIGDYIYIRDGASSVNFSPWLTEPNCKDTPSLPEPEPATLLVSVDQNTLPADGQSQAILTITLEDESSQPIANAKIAVGIPEFGTINQLSGTTDAAGQLQLIYTAPSTTELNGKDFVELNIQYSAASVSDSTVIEFTFASIDIWADPHIAPYPSDVAIIPGDSHFPGRYQFTLRDHNGQLMTDEELTVSIADSSRARLEGNDQSGGQITVLTDDQGRATVDYIYLGTPELNDKPFEDSITVSHGALSIPVVAKISVGLDIEIADINTPEQDTQVFPKTLAMRLRLIDGFRPDMDLRIYLSSLEKSSGHIIGIDVATEWINSPTPEFITTFRSIFPNYGKNAPPELYKNIGVINYANNNPEQVIVEALYFPQVTYATNTLPAILFNAPGNYWFRVRANPIILSEDESASTGFVRGASRPNLGRLFQANVLENAESVFQSVVCSFKPTDKVQFAAMTLLVDNPYSSFLPSSGAIKMFVKANGIICDFMQGNYATAAMNMVSLRSDQLENAYTSGAIDITLEEFLRLGKIVRMNGLYSKVDNINGALGLYAQSIKEKTAKTISAKTDWPEDLDVEVYKEIMNKVISGEMSAYADLDGWQALGILNDGSVDMSTVPDKTEYFSHDGVHVYLLPSSANTLNIQTSNNVDIFRFYRASKHQILSAEYNFSETSTNALLSFSLMEVDMKIDLDADGSIDDYYSPIIKSVDTTPASLEIMTNQQTYRAGDTFTLSASYNNLGDSMLVDVYFSVTSSAGALFSIPDLSPGHTPMKTNFELPGNFVLENSTVFSFPVTAALSGAGQFKIEAFLTYPGTLKPVGESSSSTVISFP